MEEYRITPVELYYLGVLLDAKYIDYQYISEMPDIQNNYQVTEQKTLEQLEKRNMIEQDFDGTVTVNEELSSLLAPVFFGSIECRVMTTWVEGNLHIDENRMTFVSREHDFYLLEEINDTALKEMIVNQELELQAMNIQKGFYSKTFSEEEMSLNETINLAISIMKGDWQDAGSTNSYQ